MHPRVILVEDDSELRESLTEYLELAELDVTAVGCAIEFYQALSKTTFDVAIVDVGLPDQSGYEVAQYLRNNTATGIIILTARSSSEDRVQGYKAGADLYFVKPVDSQELVAAIHSLIGRIASRTKSDHQTRTSAWILDKTQWALITPNGTSFNLTGKEMTFLEQLVTQHGEVVPRETLMKVLDYNQNQYDNRALDALVRRLRRKLEDQSHHDDPIKTIHAVGYCFAAPIRVKQTLGNDEKFPA